MAEDPCEGAAPAQAPLARRSSPHPLAQCQPDASETPPGTRGEQPSGQVGPGWIQTPPAMARTEPKELVAMDSPGLPVASWASGADCAVLSSPRAPAVGGIQPGGSPC